MTTYSTLIEVWQYMPLSDKRFIIRMFGSFGNWANANLKALKLREGV